jgi:tetratricopeptide (TPR) repeat protein
MGFGQFERLLECARRSIDILERCNAEQETLLARLQSTAPLTIYDDSVPGQLSETLSIARKYGDQWSAACALFQLGSNKMGHGQFDEAKAMLSQSHQIMEGLNNTWGMSFTLWRLGQVAYSMGDNDAAQQFAEECLVNARKIRQLFVIDLALKLLAATQFRKGEFHSALHYGEQAANLCRQYGFDRSLFLSLIDLADIYLKLNDRAHCRGHLHEAFKLKVEVENEYLVRMLLLAAELAMRAGEKVRIVEFFGLYKANPIYEQIELWEPNKPQQLIAQLQAELPPDVYAAAWERGQHMTLGEARALLATLL